MQLHFTFTRNPQFLSEEEVYAITPVHDPAELLKEGYALCLVWRPEFDGNTVPLETLRGVWHKPDGGKQDATLYFMQDRAEVQSRTKNALDRRRRVRICSPHGKRTDNVSSKSSTITASEFRAILWRTFCPTSSKAASSPARSIGGNTPS